MNDAPVAHQIGTSERFGSPRVDVEVAGRRGYVILPEGRAKPTPWVWYAPHFDGVMPRDLHAWICTRLLAAGVAVGGVDVGESYGSPAGRRTYTAFHRAMTQAYGLAPRACLWAQSRGGLMHYNWAVEHPELVLRIAAIYPVCDLAVWPGAEKASEAYEMTPEALQADLANHNPVLRLAPLAAAGVPILHLHGDSDTVVPLPKHTGELARRYRELGGTIEVVVIPGAEHEEISAFFESPRIVEFMIGGK
jgi:fermentation-respiration switch protein FrsA (DUF1100 family)